MAQSGLQQKNSLHELGFKIFLDRYALKDMTRETLAVGDLVIVVVNAQTGQREIGKVIGLSLPEVTIELLDGEVVHRDIEHVDKPLETDPGQMMDRVARGVAAVEKSAKLRKQWTERFRWLLEDWKFVPAGRILAAAGTDQSLTYYNCMPPNQEVLTADGYKAIAEINVGDLVVTHRNRLRPVRHKFERETEETLYIIRPKKLGFDDLRVTGDHKIYIIRSEWVNKHSSRDGLRLAQEPAWIPARELRVGDYLAIAHNSEECPPEPIFLADYLPDYAVEDGKLFKTTTRGEAGRVQAWGTHFDLNNRLELDEDLCYLFGRWLGDGCVTHRTGTDIPSGIKIVFGLDEKVEADRLAAIIEHKFGLAASVKLSSTGRWYDLWANSMPLGQFFKAMFGAYSYGKHIPNVLMHLPRELTLALLRGLFTADGYLSAKQLGIVLSNRTLSVQVHHLLLRLGYVFSIRENTHRLGKTPAYRIQATVSECADLFDDFFGVQAPVNTRDTNYTLDYDGLRWVRIGEIAAEDYSGVVMDMEVEEDHSFVSAGVVVSNCYVIPSPHDSRSGIIKTLSEMTEIMSRGGGVGINISSLRPRHAYVKGVNGRSSGSVSWGALYSFVTGLIEQGGCFGPDERILTSVGLIPAHELAERIEEGETFYAHTHKGLRRITARFRNGVKPLYEVTTKRGYKVRVTSEHKMAVLRGGHITTIPLHDLHVGDEILLLLGQGVEADYVRLKPVDYERSIMSTRLNEDVRLPDVLDEDLAYLLGYMYGDGYVHVDKKVTWQAPKAIKMATADAHPQIRARIVETVRKVFGIEPVIEDREEASANVAVYSRLMIEWLLTNGLLKAKADKIRVPEAIFRSSSPVMAAFIAGYFDADGCFRGRKGGYGIDSISRAMLEDVQQLLAINGIVSRISTTERTAQGWQTIYRLSVTGGTFKQRFAAFVDTAKASDANGKRDMYQTYPAEVFTSLNARAKYRQRIYDGVSERISVGQLARIGERLAGDGQTALAEQIDETLHTLPDAITSILPLGDSDVFDFEVEDVHLLSGAGVYTSNSRRGALMLILDDWHPDVFDFINSKRTMGQITNANISVNVSDRLMEAVKADTDWDLCFPDTSDPQYDAIWNGDLESWRAAGGSVICYRTIKAREVWNAIIESAWDSAEPGIWFGERSNKMSNSHYFNPLICTNPCVTGDTRIYTDQGLVRADALFDSESLVNVVVDGRFGTEVAITRASRVILTGVKPVYRLQTREGYYVRATADHRIMTARGWVALQDLRPGERIHILNRKGGFGTQGSLELGRVLGYVRGEQYALTSAVAGQANVRLEPTASAAISYGFVEVKQSTSEEVFQGTEDMQRGFLQALFTANGSLTDSGIQLYANSLELLEDVQQLLANFGIAARIERDHAALTVAEYSLDAFTREIGLLSAADQAELQAYLSQTQRDSGSEHFTATVESITDDGVEEVFDLTEPLTHSFAANGIVVHNCGEQSLGAYSVCNLGAINLSRFYDAEKHDVAWDTLDTCVRHATRFLDNVIDTTPYFFEDNERVQKGERRVGLNNMGLAELLIRLEVRYGSPESIELIDRLYSFIARAAYETSIELAKEKGSFPQFEGEAFAQSGFMQSMPEDIRERVRTEGIRNVTLLTQAPTGCVAPDTLVSTKSALRPIVSLGDPNGQQWQVLTTEVHTDVGLRASSHFYVNGHQPVKTITTRRGYSLTATHNHRIRVVDQDGSYVWRRMDEMRPGDRVVLKKNTMGDGERVALKQVERASNAKSDLPRMMTPEFAELLGLYMGDGYPKDRGGLHIVVSQRDADLLDYVGDLLRQVWGSDRQTPVETRQGAWVINLTGYYIARFFHANDLAKPCGNHGEGAAGAFIPDAVLRAGRACVAAFLRGLFEADGCVTRGNITLNSTSHTLIRQVQTALLGLGVVATIRTMPEHEGHFGERTLYELRILNRKEAATFVREVGFLSQRKRDQAADLGASDGRGDTIEVPALCADFYASSQGLPNTARQQIITRLKNGALNQHFVRGMIAAHPALQASRLGQLVAMNVFLDEVSQIEDGHCDTFDLSVPDNHTYIANGFVSHNTTGTMVNTSTGIEPFFSWVYYRKSRLGLHEEQVPIVKEWYANHEGETELPDHFVTAMDLLPEAHVRVQAAIQRWVDSSISKTANLPNNYTVDQTRELYELMYELGCKGGTIYRDGSRDEQVLMLKGDERAESEMKMNDTEQEHVATPHRVYPRPKKLSGFTVNTITPYGTAYITMNSDEHGYPFEVFITAPGKAGSDLQADAEGLGRMISLQLRTTAPQNRLTMLRLVIDQLQGIGGSRSAGFGPNRVLSLPDAVANALLEQYFPQEKVQQLNLFVPDEPVDVSVSSNGGHEQHEADDPYTNGNGVHDHNGAITGAALCPECRTVSLIRAEGCRKCLTCGYSEC